MLDDQVGTRQAEAAATGQNHPWARLARLWVRFRESNCRVPVAVPRTSAAAVAPSGQRRTVTPVMPWVSDPCPMVNPGTESRSLGVGSEASFGMREFYRQPLYRTPFAASFYHRAE